MALPGAVGFGGGDVNIQEVGGVVLVTGFLPVNVSGDVEVVQPTHDDLNANANIQVGNTDVAVGNPVPISDAGGSITVDGTVGVSGDVEVVQPTHDDLNCNANMQFNNGDVLHSNPLPVEVVDIESLEHLQIENIGPRSAASAFVVSPFQVGDASVGNDEVFLAGVVRDNALTTLAVSDGDYTTPRVDAQGALWVRPKMTNEHLSVATVGEPIAVNASVNLHTVPAGFKDLVTLFASNDLASNVTIQVQLGSGVRVESLVPSGEKVPILEAHLMAAGQVVSAQTIGSSILQVYGDIEREAV